MPNNEIRGFFCIFPWHAYISVICDTYAHVHTYVFFVLVFVVCDSFSL